MKIIKVESGRQDDCWGCQGSCYQLTGNEELDSLRLREGINKNDNRLVVHFSDGTKLIVAIYEGSVWLKHSGSYDLALVKNGSWRKVEKVARNPFYKEAE